MTLLKGSQHIENLLINLSICQPLKRRRSLNSDKENSKQLQELYKRRQFDKPRFTWRITPQDYVTPLNPSKIIIHCDGSGHMGIIGGSGTFISHFPNNGTGNNTVLKLGIQIPSPTTTYLNEVD